MIETRSILHVDCGGLSVAIERRCNPHLRSRPIVIGDTTLRGGIVVVCSVESRRAGIVESMPLARARKRCRDLVVVPARHDLYRDTARRIRDHLARFTPCVEAASLDRVYLDLTGTHPLFGAATGVGARLSREIAARFGLVPAVAVAANKLVACVAAWLLGWITLMTIAYLEKRAVGGLPDSSPATAAGQD